MKRILVIGARGQLAQAFKALLPDAAFLDRTIIDLEHPEAIRNALESYDASAIINTAAYTQVDKAETEEALAHRVNAKSPAIMATYCAEKNIPFVHFSTDYVFDGSGDNTWKEQDTPAPLNAYGRSKLAGEKLIADTGRSFLIFRTSWLYDAAGKNFLNTILRLANEREELKVIDDQYGAPTYAPHLAAAVLAALEAAAKKTTFPSGIYHLCSQGVATWYAFASAIMEQARGKGMDIKVKKILPIPASDYPLPAARPYNSRLDCARALSMFGVSLPSWQKGLADCMEIRK